MAWNSTENKSLPGESTKAAVGPGAPVAHNASFAGRAYRDPWDIERAYREGMQKVTWVSRCIDAIAGNQARLPIILRKDNDPMGQIVRSSRLQQGSILDILNTKTNIGENSFIFRYRLSSQLLMSTRGVFIEKVRGRDGRIIGLNLLPPQSTAPIPDPKRFVAGYEVLMPNGDKIIMKPEDVVWVRRPHPLDPYLSLTPMESAGVAIEIENLAKLYNRNFLLNDGRPGGLLVVRGEISDEDKDELRNRFRGNLGRVGQTSVIAADDGVDFVDTSSNPRDAAYIQMRQITKEEILASFGVPESVIGNASGRTFSNAGEEIRVFWSETMMPHLEPLARALDELDQRYYVDFDIEDVPSLVMYRQERHRYVLQEFQTGLITANEYREITGRKKVKSELADSMLQNPNLTPIGNTEKEMPNPSSVQIPGAPGATPGAPGMPPAPGTPEMEGQATGEQPLDPNTMQGALAAEAQDAGVQNTQAPLPPNQLVDPGKGIEVKETSAEVKETEVAPDLERWTEILGRSLERIFERQQRVVLEKVGGAKNRKALADGVLDVDGVMPQDIWDRQVEEDVRPVLNAILRDSLTVKSGEAPEFISEDLIAHVNAQISRIQDVNFRTREVISREILNSLSVKDAEHRHVVLRAAIVSHFTQLMAKNRFQIAQDEARRAWRAATAETFQ